LLQEYANLSSSYVVFVEHIHSASMQSGYALLVFLLSVCIVDAYRVAKDKHFHEHRGVNAQEAADISTKLLTEASISKVSAHEDVECQMAHSALMQKLSSESPCQGSVGGVCPASCLKSIDSLDTICSGKTVKDDKGKVISYDDKGKVPVFVAASTFADESCKAVIFKEAASYSAHSCEVTFTALADLAIGDCMASNTTSCPPTCQAFYKAVADSCRAGDSLPEGNVWKCGAEGTISQTLKPPSCTYNDADCEKPRKKSFATDGRSILGVFALLAFFLCEAISY